MSAYEINERGFPDLYLTEEKQLWFETLEHISKFEIPLNLLPKTKLKLFGIMAEDHQAVAWTYQAHNHEIYLLYNVTKLTPPDNAKPGQKERYNAYLDKLDQFNNGKLVKTYVQV